MSEQGAIAEAVAAALAARGIGGAPAAAPMAMQQQGGMQGMGGFGAPVLTPTGFLVPVKIPTPAGNVKAFIQFPAEAARDPNAAMMAIQQVANAGWPLDAWQPQQGGFGGGGGGGGFRRGYGGGGGGYGGGGRGGW